MDHVVHLVVERFEADVREGEFSTQAAHVETLHATSKLDAPRDGVVHLLVTGEF